MAGSECLRVGYRRELGGGVLGVECRGPGSILNLLNVKQLILNGYTENDESLAWKHNNHLCVVFRSMLLQPCVNIKCKHSSNDGTDARES